MKFILSTLLLGLCCININGQNTSKLFNDSRVINSHSVEVLDKGHLDIRIGHRFGDMSGKWSTLYGLENATDVYIGGEYGISDKLMAGLSRSKGSSSLKMLVNGFLKWNLIHEKNNKPVSLTILGLGTVSTMQRSSSPFSLSYFENPIQRLSYCGQAIVGKRISKKTSLQANFSALHRNIVKVGDVNTTLSAGLATRIQVRKAMAIIGDINIPLNGPQSMFNSEQAADLPEYFIPFGIGVELGTGGHIFQINLTNAQGIPQTDYLANTTSNWADGGFRLGFTISRLFKVR